MDLHPAPRRRLVCDALRAGEAGSPSCRLRVRSMRGMLHQLHDSTAPRCAMPTRRSPARLPMAAPLMLPNEQPAAQGGRRCCLLLLHRLACCSRLAAVLPLCHQGRSSSPCWPRACVSTSSTQMRWRGPLARITTWGGWPAHHAGLRIMIAGGCGHLPVRAHAWQPHSGNPTSGPLSCACA